MKKIISIVLALSMVFTLFAATTMLASANDDINADTSVSDEIITDTPEDGTETVEPTLPSVEEFSQWISEIITQVLAILAKICEVLFENVLWPAA